MNIAQIIIKARREKGFTQDSLANAASLSLSTIQRIENGKTIPRVHTLSILSEILDIDFFNSKATDGNSVNDILVYILLSLLFGFIPSLNVIFLFYIWRSKKNTNESSSTIKKVLYFQIYILIFFLVSILLTPILSYLFTGQTAYGQLNIPLIIYLFFILSNISTSILIHHKDT